MKTNKNLMVGGVLSIITSLLHVAIIIGGPDWYRFFGAGEGMAQLAENGSTYPAMITAGVAIILALWALYAFSGAGIIPQLPLLKPVLIIISLIYMIRGLLGIPITIYVDDPYLNELEERMTFMIFSSVVSLTYGLFYLKGTMQICSNNINQRLITNAETP